MLVFGVLDFLLGIWIVNYQLHSNILVFHQKHTSQPHQCINHQRLVLKIGLRLLGDLRNKGGGRRSGGTRGGNFQRRSWICFVRK